MSKPKRPSGEELRAMLTEGHFVSNVVELRPAEPVAPTPMVLEPEKIKPYDRNPRREDNTMLAEIRASIQARGLDAPLRITKRPGEDVYMIAAGGNTRLMIVQKLSQAGDARFARVHCLYTPWVSESDCLTAHLVENELRADLLPIDKALALRDLKNQLTAEAGEPISQRDFGRRLEGFGYRISLRQMRRYDYLVDVLNPAIPTALRGSEVGIRVMDAIRDCDDAYRLFYDQLPPDDSRPDFDAVFGAVLAQHDRLNFNLEACRDALDRRLEQISGIAFNLVRMIADFAQQHGGSLEGLPVSIQALAERGAAGAEPVEARALADGDDLSPVRDVINDVEGKDGADGSPEAEPPAITRPTLSGAAVTAPTPTTRPMSPPVRLDPVEPPVSERPRDRPLTVGAATAEPPAVSPSSSGANSAIKALRAQCLDSALAFAGHFPGLESLVVPLAMGHGFFIDIPPPVSTKDDPTDPAVEIGRRLMLNETYRAAWWMLYALSEMSLTPDRLGFAPDGMLLPKLLRDDPAQAAKYLPKRVGDAPHMVQLPYQLLTSRLLEPPAFAALLRLIEAIHHFKQERPEGQIWHCCTVEQYQTQLLMQTMGTRRHD